ncbi:MAG: B12-binding domain-containing radical SAM protein [Chitinophagaceae bacterium]|nr:B12-binding domain-containing radical SAM protein [Chitinophagaceae bacterium]
MNKDLNGGFGTHDDYGNSLFSKILMRVKAKGIRLPVLSFAFLQGILKQKGFSVQYFENEIPLANVHFDVILLYGTIVDFKNENEHCLKLKEQFPNSKIGFFGPFPALMPHLFRTADFVILGEAEAFFMNEFISTFQLEGQVNVLSLTDMEELPLPDFTGFPVTSYSYHPILPYQPFLILQASKGCPYSCRFYCVYGKEQGAVIRQRSVKKVADDIVCLQKQFNIKAIQFRDPVFGLKKGYIEEFSEELIKRKLKIYWGIETRLDLLNEQNIDIMYNAGLRNINAGIETSDKIIAKRNKRLLVDESHQEKIIRYCKKKGINVSAFYIIGMEGDTELTVMNTIAYAKRLNTLTARFAVSTPYPGTGYYTQMQMQNRLLTDDFEQYGQFSLVFRHEHLSPVIVKKMLNKAYRIYYLRARFTAMFLMNTVRRKFSK